MSPLHVLRLEAPDFWVDVRLRRHDGRWIASADTRDGPTLGLGRNPVEALVQALDPFDGAIDELVASIPDHLYWR